MRQWAHVYDLWVDWSLRLADDRFRWQTAAGECDVRCPDLARTTTYTQTGSVFSQLSWSHGLHDPWLRYDQDWGNSDVQCSVYLSTRYVNHSSNDLSIVDNLIQDVNSPLLSPTIVTCTIVSSRQWLDRQSDRETERQTCSSQYCVPLPGCSKNTGLVFSSQIYLVFTIYAFKPIEIRSIKFYTTQIMTCTTYSCPSVTPCTIIVLDLDHVHTTEHCMINFTFNRERESKVLPEPYGPLGGADLRSIGPQPDTSIHCKDRGYGASASCGVSLYSPAVRPVPNYTAWWQRHMGVNNLPRVVTW